MEKLRMLNGWSQTLGNYCAKKSAQSFMAGYQAVTAAGSCGSSCGTGNPKPKKPSACGSSCGTGDK